MFREFREKIKRLSFAQKGEQSEKVLNLLAK